MDWYIVGKSNIVTVSSVYNDGTKKVSCVPNWLLYWIDVDGDCLLGRVESFTINLN